MTSSKVEVGVVEGDGGGSGVVEVVGGGGGGGVELVVGSRVDDGVVSTGSGVLVLGSVVLVLGSGVLDGGGGVEVVVRMDEVDGLETTSGAGATTELDVFVSTAAAVVDSLGYGIQTVDVT